MSEREEEIMNTIEMALPVMSEFEKGYFYGIARASMKRRDSSGDTTEPELAATG